MEKKNLLKLKTIFNIVLELPNNFNVESSSMINNRKWDSLAMVSIIAAIENEFGVLIRTQDYGRMTSFKSVELLLQEAGL